MRERSPAPRVAVVIPALDEERALPHVLARLREAGVERIVVADNGSADRTAAVARAGGARVVEAPRRGYGSACLAGLAVLADDPPEIVVFIDADASDDPNDLPALLQPIVEGDADLVIGSRRLGCAERGALPLHARLGNALAAFLLRRLYGLRATDLGPFRAIRWTALVQLGMRDPDYGWTAEMQARAARLRLAVVEVPVRYRRRIGRSKISGTVTGSLRAGAKILWTIARVRWERARPAPPPLPISAIVPALDEEGEIAGCLAALARNAGPLERIVADGGSRDRTAAIAAEEEGVFLLRAPRGRAPQMNAGARAAQGEVLWFVHADARPGPDAADAIRRAIAGGAAWGAFRFALIGARAADRWLEAAVRLRTHLFRMPYGDQGLFVTREAFERVGGFPELPVLEDVELVRRLRRLGRPALLREPLPTSPRRWRRDGYLATTWRHRKILIGRALGIDPAKLAAWRERAPERRAAPPARAGRRP